MSSKYKYYSKIKPDRSDWDVFKKNEETGEEELIATFYNPAEKQAFLVFMNA